MAHTLVGAALARTRLGRSTPLAGAALLIGANLPDVDVLSYLGGRDTAFAFRRGLTHRVAAMAVLPLLLTAALARWNRWRRAGPGEPVRWWRLLGLAYLATATHPLLDWLNTYGIRLLAPFDDRWFYGDAVFIVDPWLWLLLGGAVFLSGGDRSSPRPWIVAAAGASLLVLGNGSVPLAAKAAWIVGLLFVASLAAAGRRRDRGERAALAGLLAAALYVGTMVSASSAAASWVGDELRRDHGVDVDDLMVGPTPADPLHWEVVAATPTGYRRGEFIWRGRPVLELAPRELPKEVDLPCVERARSSPAIRGTLRWMRFPFVEVDPIDGGCEVRFLDARYLRRRSGGFGSAVVRVENPATPSDSGDAP